MLLLSYQLSWRRFLRNVVTLLKDYTESYPRRRRSSSPLPWVYHIARNSDMTKQLEKGLFDRLTNRLQRNKITQQIKKDYAINQTPVAGFFPWNAVFFSTRFAWICRGSCSGKIFFCKHFGIHCQISSKQYFTFTNFASRRRKTPPIEARITL